MDNESILPWQEETWGSLWLRRQQDRMPHALLFAGVDGVGKRRFARALAAGLLCMTPRQQGRACGKCRTCHLMTAHTHPDFKWIEPEESGQIIKIDQIREVVGFVNETPMLNGYRIIVISPASAMNVYASNALLKTLEEPTPKTLLILICNQSVRLPATITSRCQRIVFSKPTPDAAIQWLETECKEAPIPMDLLLNLVEGAPLKAKDFLTNGTLDFRKELYQGLLQLSQNKSDPLQLAARLQEKDMGVILNLLLVWLRDLLRSKVTDNHTDLVNYDYEDSFQALTNKMSSEGLLSYIDHAQQAYARILSSVNANRQLVLEEMFVRWAQLCS